MYSRSRQINSSTPNCRNTSISRSYSNHAVCLRWHATRCANPEKLTITHVPCANIQFASQFRSIRIINRDSCVTYLIRIFSANQTEVSHPVTLPIYAYREDTQCARVTLVFGKICQSCLRQEFFLMATKIYSTLYQVQIIYERI